MRKLVGAMIVAALMPPLPSFAKDDPVVLAKTTKWEMNYDADSCHLLAKFGEGDDTIILNITRFEPGSTFDVMLFGKMFAADRTWVPVKIGFGDSPLDQRLGGAGLTASKQPFVLFMNLRLDGRVVDSRDPKSLPVSREMEARTTTTTISLPNRVYRLETGSLAAPFDAMRACTDSLLTAWGYDPAVQATLSKPATPIGSPANWVRAGDYPKDALRTGQSGIVEFRLDLDEAGKISNCHILRRFNHDQFSDLTCHLLTQRARFKPALDATGKLVKTFYINSVRFLVPED